MEDKTSLWGKAVCPVCLWRALKNRNCAEPKAAKRIVMLSFDSFASAVDSLEGTCSHRVKPGVKINKTLSELFAEGPVRKTQGEN